MSARRRKSHVMTTRLDKSLGFGESEDDCVDDHAFARQDDGEPCIAKKARSENVDPIQFNLNVPSPTRYGGIAFRNKSNVTIPKPFTFVAKDEEMRRRREQLAEDAKKQAILLANSFRACPMRVGPPDPLPEVNSREPVRPQPFNFHCEDRLIKRRSRCQDSTTYGEQSVHQSIVKSPSVLYRPPFLPKPANRTPLQPISPDLATSRRAEARQQYDEEVNRRRKSLESKQQKAEEARAEQERQELVALRARLVHKPNPIRRYQSIRVPSAKPAPTPRSPQLSARTRKITHV
ncbi:hypothetical protein AHF37_04907 [Paragonimus kellicotti]|nr:hypothetical protein AHF37_04907 [Paragonimus kellicotti]